MSLYTSFIQDVGKGRLSTRNIIYPGVPSAMPEVYPWVYNNVYHRHWSHNMFLRVTAVVHGLEVYH